MHGRNHSRVTISPRQRAGITTCGDNQCFLTWIKKNLGFFFSSLQLVSLKAFMISRVFMEPSLVVMWCSYTLKLSGKWLVNSWFFTGFSLPWELMTTAKHSACCIIFLSCRTVTKINPNVNYNGNVTINFLEAPVKETATRGSFCPSSIGSLVCLSDCLALLDRSGFCFAFAINILWIPSCIYEPISCYKWNL